MNFDILLVYPYFRTQAPTELLFQPLGIASLASQLKSLGLSVATLDCTFMTFEKAIEWMAAERTAIVGISVMITLSAHAIRLAQTLKPLLPETLFVCGGPLPTLYPERFIRAFDVVFRGESDCIFPKFCNDYLMLSERNAFRDRLDLSQYPGIFIHSRSGVREVPSIHHTPAVLDALPIPDRAGGDHDRYQKFWIDKTGFKRASMLVTRGCPFQCDFCSKPVFGSYFRKRSVAKVLDEIDDIKGYGYDHSG